MTEEEARWRGDIARRLSAIANVVDALVLVPNNFVTVPLTTQEVLELVLSTSVEENHTYQVCRDLYIRKRIRSSHLR